MKKTLFASLTLAIALASGIATAEETVAAPAQPRVNEVEQRLENQQQRIDNGVAAGEINAKQAAHDEAVNKRVAKQLSAAEAKHNGHITKREQRRLNRELNHNSHHIARQRTHGADADTTPAAK